MTLSGLEKLDQALRLPPRRIEDFYDLSAALVLLAAVRGAVASHLLERDPSMEVHRVPLDVLVERAAPGGSSTLAERLRQSVREVEDRAKDAEYRDDEYKDEPDWMFETDAAFRLLRRRLFEFKRALA